VIYFNQQLRSTSPPFVDTFLPEQQTVDLALTENGDLALTATEDLKLSQDREVIISNLFRRITTPLGGYERYSFTAGDYLEIDPGWSDPLLGALSAPLTNTFGNWAVDRLNDITAKDPRLTVLSVELIEAAPVPHLQIYYLLNQQTYTTNLTVPAII
jgi:hypothetical protein